MDELLEQIRKTSAFDDYVEELKQAIEDETSTPVPALVLRLLAPAQAAEVAQEMENENEIVRSYRALVGLGA